MSFDVLCPLDPFWDNLQASINWANQLIQITNFLEIAELCKTLKKHRNKKYQTQSVEQGHMTFDYM